MCAVAMALVLGAGCLDGRPKNIGLDGGAMVVAADGNGGGTPNVPVNAPAVSGDGCLYDSDCEGTASMCDRLTGSCSECIGHVDCEDAAVCQAGACVLETACNNSLDCVDTGDLSICDRDNSRCVECLLTIDCPEDSECKADICTFFTPCVNSLDCPAGRVCNVPLGRCAQCVDSNDCGPDMLCSGGSCWPPCESDNDCTALRLLCDRGAGHCAEADDIGAGAGNTLPAPGGAGGAMASGGTGGVGSGGAGGNGTGNDPTCPSSQPSGTCIVGDGPCTYWAIRCVCNLVVWVCS